MFRLMSIFFMAATTLMGSAVVAALVSGYDTMQPVLIAVVVGFVLALPVTWIVDRQIR